MLIIGEINGDGEVVCFSKNEGIFVRVFEGKTTEINDFACVLKEIIKLMDEASRDVASVMRSVPVYCIIMEIS